MNTKQIEAIKLRRDIMLELTDHVVSSHSTHTEEQKDEIMIYKDYLKNISDYNYEWKQPPIFFKTNRLYNVIVECQDALAILKTRGLI